jgi:hypothetical protein
MFLRRAAFRSALAVHALTGVAVLTATAVLTAHPAQAQRASEDWVLLGTAEVDRTRSRELIDLRSARGQVKAVRLVAKRNGAELIRVSVTYSGGQVHDEARRINMNPNDRTRAIDQLNEGRFVDQVELGLQPARGLPAAERTMTMEVWGLQTSAGARAERPMAPVAAPSAAPPVPVAPVIAPPAAPAPVVAAVPPAPIPQVTAQPAAPTPRPVAVPLVVAPPVPAAVAMPPPAPPVTAQVATTAPPTPTPVGGVPAGVTPPLPPPRGPDGRVAMMQKGPNAPAVAPKAGPAMPSVGEETRDGIFLGRRTLGGGGETETIPAGLDFGRFDKIRLRSLDAGIRIAKLTVNYTTGAPDILPIDADISASGRTRWLAITGDRIVRDIEVTYRRRDNGRNAATIEVFGEHATGYLDPGGEGARITRYNGWVPMGARTAALRVGFDQLEFEIGRNKGGFKKLRIDAKDRAITLREVRVVYVSGEDEIFAIDTTRQRVAAGASFGPIDVRGGTRPVKSVILKTRSRFLDSEARGRDAAVVEVWGQH